MTINDGGAHDQHQVTGLANGTRYHFRVLAKNVAGNSAASNIANGIPRTMPTAPRSLTATPGEVQAVLRGCSRLQRRCGGHRLHHRALTQRNVELGDDQRRGAHDQHLHGDRFDQRHPLLLPGTAKNAAGNSAWSNTANAIPRTKPTAPRSLTAAPTNLSGQVRLSWLLRRPTAVRRSPTT